MKHSIQKLFILLCCISPFFETAVQAMESLNHTQLQTGLAHAIQAGDVDYMHELIEYGADPKELRNGWSMLHYAQCAGPWRVVFLGLASVLQERKLKECDCRHVTDLHRDEECRHSIIVKFLLEQGVDPNLKTSTGTTALHFAAQGGCIAVAKLLCQAGADVEARDQFGGTPLFAACNMIAGNRFALPKYECLSTARLLIQEYNADITTVQTGDNPFLYLIKDATDTQGTPIIDLFKGYKLQRKALHGEVLHAEVQD